MVLELKMGWYLWSGGKCLVIRARKSLAMGVITCRLKGGLYQVTCLFLRFLCLW